MALKRYSPYLQQYFMISPSAELEEDAQGEWVRYEDALEALKEAYSAGRAFEDGFWRTFGSEAK